jgi:hydrogenase maturation protease
MKASTDSLPIGTLVLGIGNLLMGDEGVGVEVARRLAELPLPPDVEVLDGGTGSFVLLEPMPRADRIVLVDAALDSTPPGTVRRLTPRFSREYPRSLTAHDIGLKDLLDAFHLLGEPPEVVLFAVSVQSPVDPRLELSAPVAAAVPGICRMVRAELEQPAPASAGSALAL